MLLIFILKIKIRAVSRASHFRALDFGVISAAHRFRKTDHLSFSSADRPIVSVTADCEDPLLRVGILQQAVQPAFKPRARCQRPGRIRVRGFVKQHRYKTIDVIGKRLEIDVIQFLVRLNAQPKLLVIVVQRVSKLVDESSDVFFVSRVDLLPVDHNARCFRVAQDGKHTLDKPVLSLRRSVREIFNRFRLPRVTDKICQQRQKRDALVCGQFR